MSTATHIPVYTVRQYEGGPDYHMVNEWYGAHGKGQLPEVLLPPDGFIVQEDGRDTAAAWCYFATGIGVGHVEWLVSRPGLSLKQARVAIKHLIDLIWLHAQNNNYGALIFHTVPAAARFAGGWGLRVASTHQISLMRTA